MWTLLIIRKLQTFNWSYAVLVYYEMKDKIMDEKGEKKINVEKA